MSIELKIINKSLKKYIKSSKNIKVSYFGNDFKVFCQTVVMCFSIKNNIEKEEITISIDCNKQFENYIPDCFKQSSEDNLIDLVIKSEDGIRYNHKSLIKGLQIDWPLSFNFENEINNQKKMMICFGNEKQQQINKTFQNSFIDLMSKKRTIIIPKIPHVNIETYNKEINSWDEMINTIRDCDDVVCIDNSILFLASCFLNKNVIGIFGPTIPEMFTNKHSMKFISLKDDRVINKTKTCPCLNTKFCHNKSIDNTVFCYENFNYNQLIKNIEQYVFEFNK